MSLREKIQADITAIETYLLSYLPVDHHDQIRRAVAVAGANVDTTLDVHPPGVGVDEQTSVPDSAAPDEPTPVQGDLDLHDTSAPLKPLVS